MLTHILQTVKHVAIQLNNFTFINPWRADGGKGSTRFFRAAGAFAALLSNVAVSPLKVGNVRPNVLMSVGISMLNGRLTNCGRLVDAVV